ncbi:hypothetical protein ACMXYX_17680 (plasmid) [Neptuniibacter sp. QD72_48]|uniref:hypothetical protein n=1 Tax=Neptuniibacter sp. QD72_48 TaxID=3398214 RepID=UPI0039F5787D
MTKDVDLEAIMNEASPDAVRVQFGGDLSHFFGCYGKILNEEVAVNFTDSKGKPKELKDSEVVSYFVNKFFKQGMRLPLCNGEWFDCEYKLASINREAFLLAEQDALQQIKKSSTEAQVEELEAEVDQKDSVDKDTETESESDAPEQGELKEETSVETKPSEPKVDEKPEEKEGKVVPSSEKQKQAEGSKALKEKHKRHDQAHRKSSMAKRFGQSGKGGKR